MAVWTAFVTWAYAAPQRRRAPLLVADLLVALVAIAASPYIKGDDLRATLPGFWVMGVVLAWAIHWRLAGRAGRGDAWCPSADLAVRPEITQTNYSNIFLLMLGGPIVGFLSGRCRRWRASATVAERAGRGRRRAGPAGPGGARRRAAGARAGPAPRRRARGRGRRARPAGRRAGGGAAALIQRPGVVPAPRAGRPSATSPCWHRTAGPAPPPQVEVAAPGSPVPLAAARRARRWSRWCGPACDNVTDARRRDARPGCCSRTSADQVVVSVRDDGPGIAGGRLDEAAAEGRLGVSESIRGRVAGPRRHRRPRPPRPGRAPSGSSVDPEEAGPMTNTDDRRRARAGA